jgi:hypothetical protein
VRNYVLVLSAGLIASVALCAQQTRDPDAVMARARTQLADTVQRLPRYMCLQTVNRSFFRPESLISRSSCDQILAARRTRKKQPELIATDRLRLQVAITDSGREIYSWADAAHIETESNGDGFGLSVFSRRFRSPEKCDTSWRVPVFSTWAAGK